MDSGFSVCEADHTLHHPYFLHDITGFLRRFAQYIYADCLGGTLPIVSTKIVGIEEPRMMSKDLAKLLNAQIFTHVEVFVRKSLMSERLQRHLLHDIDKTQPSTSYVLPLRLSREPLPN